MTATVVEKTPCARVGDIKEGNNPRTFYDPQEMAELEDSVRAVGGIIQPILVRPIEDGFEVVAGYRRRRAAQKVLGEDYQIPIHVKEMTDAEVEMFALIENVVRADMSPAEEAAAAAKVLGHCGNDRDEAAKRLGWSRTTLDKRLALMNCSESVLKALSERKISLGHAELLAAAPKPKQDSVLEKMLAAPAMPSVAQFKAQLASISKSLETAIFDKSGCAGCPHDSSAQAAMFAESIGTGHCTNAECFDKKTDEALELKKDGLADEFPQVKIVRPGENFTIIKLVADGATGVGDDQAKACRACANFGAVISAVPGKVGNVYRDQCFDGECHTKKVAERIKSEKEAAKPTAPAGTAKATAGKPAAASLKGAAKAEAKAPATTVQDTQRVKDYRVKEWRKALKKELFADPRENLSMLIGVMMTRGGTHVSSTKLTSAFEKLTGQRSSNSTNVGEAAGLVSKADDSVRQQMLSGIVISIADSIEVNQLVQMLVFMEVDLAKHWKLNAEYLELLTKSEIEVVAEEIGLKAHLGDKFSKIVGGKKDEAIKALLAAEGFDFSGKVPASMQYADK